jgi:hypothetical protein
MTGDPQFGAGGGQLQKKDGSEMWNSDTQEEFLGGKGFAYIIDTAAHVPVAGSCFKAIHFTASSVVAAYSVDSTAPLTGATIIGATFAAGVVIYGKFTSITLTSGACIAYNGVL